MKPHSGVSADGKERNAKSPAFRVFRSGWGDLQRKLKRSSQRKRRKAKKVWCFGSQAKNKHQGRAGATIASSHEEVTGDMGKNSFLEIGCTQFKEVCLMGLQLWAVLTRNRQRSEDSQAVGTGHMEVWR